MRFKYEVSRPFYPTGKQIEIINYTKIGYILAAISGSIIGLFIWLSN